MNHHRTLVPPIKCQGIKTRLVSWIRAAIPADFAGTWIEPFMGSGVVAFNVRPQRALLADSNPHLINFYKAIADGSITSVATRRFLEREGAALLHSGGEHYYVVRERFNQRGDPMDFLFLNRACFNGLIRFNQKGGFNVPFCRKPNRFARAYISRITNQVQAISDLIRFGSYKFLCQDFTKTIAAADDGDLIYCDPPYIDRHADYFSGWSGEREGKLAGLLSSAPCKFILSTWHGNEYRRNVHIDGLWSKFPMLTREHFYHVGAKEDNRNPMLEALVMNYQVVSCETRQEGMGQPRLFGNKARCGAKAKTIVMCIPQNIDIEVKVEALALSVRALNCLHGRDIGTVRRLVQQDEASLYDIPHLGRKTLGEIINALEAHGLRLNVNFDDFLKALLKAKGLGTHPIFDAQSLQERGLSRNADPCMPLREHPLNTVDQELHFIVSRIARPRQQRIAMARFGWRGGPISTLESLGTDIGVTRERIRQIAKEVEKDINDFLAGRCPPMLLKALRLVESALPMDKRGVPELLQKEGISETGLSYEALRKAAELSETPWEIMEFDGILISVRDRQRVEKVKKALVSLRTKPFANVDETGLSDSAAQFVEASPDYAWLDRSAGVFWRANWRYNKVVFVCKKIFSLVGRLYADEVIRALERAKTIQEAPSKTTLLEMLRQTEWFDIHGEEIIRKDNVTFANLSGIDKKLLKATKGLSTPLRFSDLCSNLVRGGMSSNQAGVVIHTSPLIYPVVRGKYCLLGDKIEDGNGA